MQPYQLPQKGFFNVPCDYKGCGQVVGHGYRYKDLTMHPDCFLIHTSEKNTELELYLKDFDIEKSQTPEVVVTSEVLDHLIDLAVEKFPIQNNLFTGGAYSENEIAIYGYIEVPIFKYRMTKYFSGFKFDFTDFDALVLANILVNTPPNGYIHIHDCRDIGSSDIQYDAIYRMACANTHRNLKVRGQLNGFIPVLKQLVLLNHERFKGKKPIADMESSIPVRTEHFLRYFPSKTNEDSEVVRKARSLAKREMKSNIEKYFSIYSAATEAFEPFGIQEISIMCEEVKKVLHSDDSYKIDKLLNTRLVNLLKGRIKQLPFVIK